MACRSGVFAVRAAAAFNDIAWLEFVIDGPGRLAGCAAAPAAIGNAAQGSGSSGNVADGSGSRVGYIACGSQDVGC